MPASRSSYPPADVHRDEGPLADNAGMALPSIAPMLASSGDLPGPDAEASWAYEMKWDGVRAMGYLEDGSLRLLSRNDRDITEAYPELTSLAGELPGRSLVLDGEVVAFDAHGRPSFGALQPRMHLRDARRVRQLASESPVAYLVFDLLYADGNSLLDVPYVERRVALAGLGLNGQRWQAPPAFQGDGAAARAASEAAGLEGVVAKRLASLYRPGRRSTDWVKAKHQRTQEVVVLGWQPGKGRRSGGVGALVLGVPDADGTLRYAGQVGTGFPEAVLADLARRLRPLERKTSPLAQPLPARDVAGVHWVSPKLVGEVKFSEWTRDGRLRHPVW
jgi:bifunctional non-homologous end joining protein LigD